MELNNEKGRGLQEIVRGLDASRMDEHRVDIEIQQSPERLMAEADVGEKGVEDIYRNGDEGMRSSQERSFGGLEQNAVSQPEGENVQLLVKSFVIVCAPYDFSSN